MFARMSLGRLVMASLLLSLPACEDDWPSRGDAPAGPGQPDEDDLQDPGEECVELCDPVEQDCPAGEACLPNGNEFSCQGLAHGDGVRLGLHEPCELGSRMCDPGLVCLPVAVPGCVGGSGCCVVFCDVNRPECDDDTTCVRYFEEGALCHEEVGVCVSG